MSPPDQTTARPDLHRLRVAGVSFLVFIAAVLIYGMVSRAAQNSRIHDLTEAQQDRVIECLHE